MGLSGCIERTNANIILRIYAKGVYICANELSLSYNYDSNPGNYLPLLTVNIL